MVSPSFSQRLSARVAAFFPSDDKVIFTPKDAAKVAGVDADSVTRFVKTRPDLFPERRAKGGKLVRKIEWVRSEFITALAALSNLSPKAGQVLSAA